ncbi:MAG: hypothetical protein HY575_06935 [candidate division NC10 bacterium]|nr:hypothetical protein [candidate division NC10 bacterium]
MSRLLTLAQTSRLDEIVKAGVVRVGVFTDLEPYGFLDAIGKNVGYDVDIASELLIRLYGDRRRHARSAIGTNQLPLDIPVEVEMVVRVRD